MLTFLCLARPEMVSAVGLRRHRRPMLTHICLPLQRREAAVLDLSALARVCLVPCATE